MLKIPAIPSPKMPRPTAATWPSSRARYGTAPGRVKASGELNGAMISGGAWKPAARAAA